MTERDVTDYGDGHPDGGWRLDDRTFLCEDCDWRIAAPRSAASGACPRCAGRRMLPMPAGDAVHLEHVPEMLVRPVVSDDEMHDALAGFCGYRFKPSDLTLENLHDRMRLVYVPMWLVDARARALWQAEVGFSYEVVSHEDSFSGGRWQSQEVTETRVRWEPRSGHLDRRYDNAPAAALEAHEGLWGALGGWEPRGAVPVDSSALGDAAVVLPTRDKADAWPDAEPHVQRTAAEECCAAAGADHVRRFAWSVEYSDRHWSLLLLPMLTTFYECEDGRREVVMINGQSGLLVGRRRESMRGAWRWTVPLAVAALVPLAASLAARVAGYAQVGLWAFAVAVLLGLVAITPVFYVWATDDEMEYRSQ